MTEETTEIRLIMKLQFSTKPKVSACFFGCAPYLSSVRNMQTISTYSTSALESL
jgi:hypothetical protein